MGETRRERNRRRSAQQTETKGFAKLTETKPENILIATLITSTTKKLDKKTHERKQHVTTR